MKLIVSLQYFIYIHILTFKVSTLNALQEGVKTGITAPQEIRNTV